jgi:hypothetical protein
MQTSGVPADTPMRCDDSFIDGLTAESLTTKIRDLSKISLTVHLPGAITQQFAAPANAVLLGFSNRGNLLLGRGSRSCTNCHAEFAQTSYCSWHL